jgi:hypothetical protein
MRDDDPQLYLRTQDQVRVLRDVLDLVELE